MIRRPSAPLAATMQYALAATFLVVCLFSSPPARADIDVQINIGNAPPPPRFVFDSRPHERYYASERVYVVDDPRVGDNDVFRYGGYYWVFYDGYWYRARSWRGPFAVIYPRYVPTVFYRMPPARWKHRPSGPPGYARPAGHQQPASAPPHVKPAGAPGHKQQGNTPPGQQKKAPKGHDKGGGHGK